MNETLRCLMVGVCAGLAAMASADEKKAVPLYTNEDLRRVAPYRDETGVNSKPAAAPSAEAPPARSRVRGEEYWRREADRLRDRLRPLRERAAELRITTDDRRQRMEDGRRSRGMRASGPNPVAVSERRLRLLEERIREAETRFEDRARREGALPGWLR